MGMTPYEQRFNYYMAAKDQLTNAYHCKFTEAQYLKESGQSDIVMPKYPTPKDIFDLAEDIKAFAEKK